MTSIAEQFNAKGVIDRATITAKRRVSLGLGERGIVVQVESVSCGGQAVLVAHAEAVTVRAWWSAWELGATVGHDPEAEEPGDEAVTEGPPGTRVATGMGRETSRRTAGWTAPIGGFEALALTAMDMRGIGH